MSNKDPDQVYFVGPDPDPNCMQRLSTDERFTAGKALVFKMRRGMMI